MRHIWLSAYLTRTFELMPYEYFFTCAGKLPQIFGGFGKRINCPDIYEVRAKCDKYCNDN